MKDQWALGLNGCESGCGAPAGTYHFTDNTWKYTPRGYLSQGLGFQPSTCLQARGKSRT
jgi:hypothetical protein